MKRTHDAAPAGLSWLVIGLAGLVLASFAGLLPMANWRPDEYHDFGLFRTEGWSFFFRRLLTWSPRPLSESVAGLYFLAEEGSGHQLVTPFLALLWSSLLIGPLLFVRRGPGRARLVIAAVVVCLTMLGHSVAEVFYWPMGAVAYVPTLAAIVAVAFQIVDGRWDRRRGLAFLIVCLLCAASSAEVGALFVIVFATGMIALHLTKRIGSGRDAIVWLVPLAMGLVVFVALSLGRGSLAENITYRGVLPNPTYLGHPFASLARAVPTYFRELAVLDGAEAGKRAILLGATLKVLIGFGFLALFRGSRSAGDPAGQRWVLAVLVASLQATCFLSIAGSYYKFGLVCCERHDTVRQCLALLTLLSGAALLATVPATIWPRWSRTALTPTIGAAVLGGVMVVMLGRELGTLEQAYAAWPTAVSVRRANWAAGHGPGPGMIFAMAPMPPVVSGMLPPATGSFRLAADPPWLWELVMKFYRKQEIELRPVSVGQRF